MHQSAEQTKSGIRERVHAEAVRGIRAADFGRGTAIGRMVEDRLFRRCGKVAVSDGWEGEGDAFRRGLLRGPEVESIYG
jgi:hypothetical protein